MNEINITNAKQIFTALPKRPLDSNKGTFGTLTAICGSANFIGAAYLCVLGALRSGVGIVCLASVERVIAAVASRIAECTYLPMKETTAGSISAENADVLLARLSPSSPSSRQAKNTAALVGCGMTNTPATAELVRALIEGADCPLILDADALNAVSADTAVLNRAKKTPIITPHIGEMARLTGRSIDQIKGDTVNTAVNFAASHNCVTVLKDFRTVIAHPDGRYYINKTGNPGLAKGGSGDVLAGIISSFTAQGREAFDAAVCGVYLHGLAADRCAERKSQYGMLPSDILDDLCDIFLDYYR
jgi:NAD(P)H-hydrate epimerase